MKRNRGHLKRRKVEEIRGEERKEKKTEIERRGGDEMMREEKTKVKMGHGIREKR